MKLIIENMAGQKLEFQANPNDTILSLKKQFEQKDGVLVADQQLLFNNKDLDDNNTIANSHLKEGDIIIMTAKLMF